MASRLRLVLHLLLASALAGAVNSACAQKAAKSDQSAFADPTRPPAAMMVEVPSLNTKAVVPAAGLQAVVLQNGTRKLAVINGETVPLGGKLGESTLIGLSESEAVLEGPNGKEIMHMTPGVEKKLNQKPAVNVKRSGGRAKHVPKETEQN